MTPAELLRELNESDEGQRIEAKRASEIGKSVMETVSAFSNTPGLGGGYLLLGVSQGPADLFGVRHYVAEGVADPDKVSADLASQCANMLSTPVRPVVEREDIDGRVVVSAFIPEAAADLKPVSILGGGTAKAAYLRVGTTDQLCRDADLTRLYQGRSARSFDSTLVAGTTEADASPLALANYRRARRERDPRASELSLEDPPLLRALRAVQRDDGGIYRFTVAGLLLFGHEDVLRDHFPMTRADYVRVQGRTWMPSAVDRFTSLPLHGPIFETVYRLEAAIMDDLPTRFSLPEGSLHRVDLPLLPRDAVREALVNALMHRDYQVHAPTQVIRYSNRIEFRNAGYSLKPEEELGQPGSEPRNPALAAVLHRTRLAETMGSGIATMRQQMHDADLTPPTFFSSREQNRFLATLLMLHTLEPETLAWLAHFDDLGLSREDRQALVFARETGQIRNEDYRNLNDADTLTASRALQRLRDLDLLAPHERGAATYYAPTERLLEPPAAAPEPTDAQNPPVDPQPVQADRQTMQASPQRMGVDAENPPVDQQNPPVDQQNPPVDQQGTAADEADRPSDRAALLTRLPPDLQQDVRTLSRRPDHRHLRTLVRRICALGAWSARDLGSLLDRKHRDLVRAHLSPMVHQGILQHTQTGRSARNQTYRTADDAD